MLLDVRTGPQVQISVQPLCVLHRPLCFQRLAALGAALPGSTQGGRLLESINRLQDPAGRMLCKARLVEGASAPPEVNIQVGIFVVWCQPCKRPQNPGRITARWRVGTSASRRHRAERFDISCVGVDAEDPESGRPSCSPPNH